MDAEKDQLRAALRQQRTGLLPADRAAKSDAITTRCLDLINWDSARQFHCYQSITDLHEVETDRLTAALHRHGATIDTPEVSARQPSAAELDTTYDVIIVPMLGFDQALHRLGYGGGYYDRLLAAHPQAQKIGLCYQSGLVQALPHDSHDMALDIVVTEDRVYRA